MNNGTLTTAPVANVAGLVPPVAVSPRKPGSVSITSITTWFGGVTANGAPLYSAHRTLIDYGLIREFHNPQGFGSVRYYRLSERGRDFAERACENWRRRPLLQRLAVRLAC